MMAPQRRCPHSIVPMNSFVSAPGKKRSTPCAPRSIKRRAHSIIHKCSWITLSSARPSTAPSWSEMSKKGSSSPPDSSATKAPEVSVVSIADLHDLEVELDINQNDFAKLNATQPGIVTTDAYPDRKYQGVIHEISPEANRLKATVQVKVKVINPDAYLRPEMNAMRRI